MYVVYNESAYYKNYISLWWVHEDSCSIACLTFVSSMQLSTDTLAVDLGLVWISMWLAPPDRLLLGVWLVSKFEWALVTELRKSLTCCKDAEQRVMAGSMGDPCTGETTPALFVNEVEGEFVRHMSCGLCCWNSMPGLNWTSTLKRSSSAGSFDVSSYNKKRTCVR